MDTHLKRCIQILEFSKWPPFQNGHHFKMAANANIKIKQIVKNSKMKRFQWKWIFTGGKTCCTIWRPFWFAMAAILNPKWPPKNKNPQIWKKFDFQVDLFFF
jgi:hypothetical protein